MDEASKLGLERSYRCTPIARAQILSEYSKEGVSRRVTIDRAIAQCGCAATVAGKPYSSATPLRPGAIYVRCWILSTRQGCRASYPLRRHFRRSSYCTAIDLTCCAIT